jgi:hydroxyacylglutathione hydrolase
MKQQSTSLEINMFPCLSDNYGYLIHDAQHNLTAAIDTPEVQPILEVLTRTGWTLTYILNTHHHWDHAGGNLELKNKTGCTIVGPRAESKRIPGIDITVGEGDTFKFGGHIALIHDTPGHTLGHIVYHFAKDKVAFVGDTLFAMGCGRLFEGTPAQMWNSLQKIMQWPNDTKIYCAHEYTQMNAQFALTIEPHNTDLITRAENVDQLRKQNIPTIPTLLSLEKKTNPFLRPMSESLRTTLRMPNASDTEVFAKVRQLKDVF